MKSLLSVFTCLLLAYDANAIQPLEIVWNTQTHGKWGCEREYDVPIDVTQYGMIVNEQEGSDSWGGEHITIFYIDSDWPHITEDGEYVHNGLPQLGDVDADMYKLEVMINERIPDPEFEGLGVLDFEEFRPLYDMNFGSLERYQIHSRNLVQEEHEDWTAEEIKNKAELDFNAAARRYFEGGLELARRLRPKGKWGYYIYPLCFNQNLETPCAGVPYNQELTWLADASGALYPSAYFYPFTPPERERAVVHGANYIAQHMLNITGQQSKPIYAYNWVNNHQYPFVFYSKSQLMNSIGVIADQGIDGIVLWGNNNLRREKYICLQVQEYMDSILGPYVQRVLDFDHQCSRDLCSSGGRCIKKHIEVDPSLVTLDFDKDHVYNENIIEDYYCQCYEGNKGVHCEDDA